MSRSLNIITVSLCFTTTALALAAAQSKPMAEHVTAAETVKFTPLDPKNPGGIQVSVVSGDLMGKGPVAFFMKLGKGASPLHSHTAGYHAVLTRGQAKHWSAGGETKAQVLNPGSHWYQPGTQNHGDECLVSECLIYLQVEGGFDFIPAQK